MPQRSSEWSARTAAIDSPTAEVRYDGRRRPRRGVRRPDRLGGRYRDADADRVVRRAPVAGREAGRALAGRRLVVTTVASTLTAASPPPTSLKRRLTWSFRRPRWGKGPGGRRGPAAHEALFVPGSRVQEVGFRQTRRPARSSAVGGSAPPRTGRVLVARGGGGIHGLSPPRRSPPATRRARCGSPLRAALPPRGRAPSRG